MEFFHIVLVTHLFSAVSVIIFLAELWILKRQVASVIQEAKPVSINL